MKTIFRFAATLLLLAYSLTTAERALAFTSSKLLEEEKVQEDLEHLKSLLRRIHPNLYAHNNRTELNKRFSKIEKSVRRFNDIADVMISVQQILTAVCDEHTSLAFSKHNSLVNGGANRFWGQDLAITKDKIYIDGTLNGGQPHQILSINGKKDAEIIRFLKSITPADGCLKNSAFFTRQGGLDRILLLGHFLGGYVNYQYTVAKGVGTPKEAVAKGQTPNHLAYWFRIRDAVGREIPLLKLGINAKAIDFLGLRSSKGTGIFVLKSPDKRHAYIHMSSFVNDEKQTKAINTIMRSLIKEKPEHVILDLTESPGGAAYQASRLLSYFLRRPHRLAQTIYRRTRQTSVDKSFEPASAELHKAQSRSARQFRKVKRRSGLYTLRLRRHSFGNPSYNGKLTVLISPRTHSAATMTALILKNQRNATIVGYQDAGDTATSCAAAAGTYELPNSKLRVKIPKMCFKRDQRRKAKGGSLTPDIKIDPLAHPSHRLLRSIIEAGVEHVMNSSQTANRQ